MPFPGASSLKDHFNGDADCISSATTTTTQASFPLASVLRAEFVCSKPEMRVVTMEDFNTLESKNTSQQSNCSYNT